jgi:S-adenosylmethionine synthetase
VDRSAAMLHVILLKLSCRWCCWRNFSTSFLCYRFSKPMGIFIDTYGTSKLNLTNGELLKSRSYLWYASLLYWATIKTKKPIYSETAAYGHMGRTPELLKHFLLQVGIRKRLRLNYLHGKN